jgi:exosortase
LFGIFCVAAGLMFYEPFRDLLQSSLRSDYYTHIILIPFISAFLLYQNKKDLFNSVSYGLYIGIPLVLAGIALYVFGRINEGYFNQNDYSSLMAFSAVIVLNGSFILFYGIRTFKAAAFPLLFLALMIPVPVFLMDQIIYSLQVGASEFSNLLFKISGVPYVREGFVFHLPNVSVQVAPQCSGIRSSMALLITSILAGHMFLKTGWKKAALVLCVIPVTFFKNAVRIVTLTLLGAYVNIRILTSSSLHSDGGIIFFILALFIMAPILYYLRKSEK